MFLQSAILGLGAYLVLQDAVSPGVMIASSILTGRALAPIETLINQWPVFLHTRLGWNSLAALLAQVPPSRRCTALPAPCTKLELKNLTVIPPQETQAALKLVNFELFPGQALGVIGPSGAGKSTLARALTTIWAPTGGTMQLDSASLDHYDPAPRVAYIGYLPQKVHFFNGSITQKIASAAQKADAHEMILHLPEGCDTMIGADVDCATWGRWRPGGVGQYLGGDHRQRQLRATFDCTV